MTQIDSIALFRLSVLGPMVSRERLERGELQQLIRQMAQREYAIPGSQRRHLGEKTIEAWYYAWRQGGIVGLTPKVRVDRGQSKLAQSLQEAVLAAKRDNPRRSIRQIQRLLEASGAAANNSLSSSAIHRLLQLHGLSRITGSVSLPEEKRSFGAEFAGSIWYGDVMHGPRLAMKGQMRKTYLVSLFDDASRLVTHSAFCLGETALDIEGVLKQALLKRGVPIKLVVDNGAAYRATTLQGLCVRLGIHLIFCRPYAPEGKGKLERWHRTFRDQFLSELDERHITDLADLNARLWAWLEQIYHRTEHAALGGMTPLARYQQDLARIRSLGAKAATIDSLFYHRVARFVKKDGTVSYLGQQFEVPYELSGKTVKLVVDPHAKRVLGVENDAGLSLGAATPLDRQANLKRVRRKPAQPGDDDGLGMTGSTPKRGPGGAGPNLVELAHRQYYATLEA
ncbi:MAG: transposase [Rhodoferax sp.]|uniref:DDE-type integrase/transposase/recombinase n=1 Tax=Rhodoferax sp. TaxID=50421 RepID=UPI00140136E3|nr:DDE-type integrase/transposase/recombinase [Rhodoferax sp.]NDP40797.1 transposase [Rhodoferax sp.]